MGASTLFIMGSLFTIIIGIISFSLTNAKNPSVNSLYDKTSSLILTYAIGGSLLMYGMMLYLFSAFPNYAALYLIIFDIFLIVLSHITLFINPLRVQARANGASGFDSTDPAFLALTLSTCIIVVLMIALLLYYKNLTDRYGLLILINLLVIPSFFLTSGAINSYALNDFTNNF